MMFDPPIKLSPRGVRWLYASAVAIALIGSTTYVSARLRVMYHLQYVTAKQGEELRTYKEHADAIHESLAARLDNLERAIYGELLKPQKAPTVAPSVEQWQLNRDRELRRRIQELEKWRFDQREGRH